MKLSIEYIVTGTLNVIRSLQDDFLLYLGKYISI